VIAYVHGLRNWGAVEEYVAALARELRGDAVIVHPDDPRLAPFAETGVRTVPFDLDSPALLPRLVRILRGLRPRVVHVTEVFPQALV
jgi:hypothetical protein